MATDSDLKMVRRGVASGSRSASGAETDPRAEKPIHEQRPQQRRREAEIRDQTRRWWRKGQRPDATESNQPITFGRRSGAELCKKRADRMLQIFNPKNIMMQDPSEGRLFV